MKLMFCTALSTNKSFHIITLLLTYQPIGQSETIFIHLMLDYPWLRMKFAYLIFKGFCL